MSVQAGQGPSISWCLWALLQYDQSTKAFSRQVTIYRQLKWKSREQNPELNPILRATKLKLLLGGISVFVYCHRGILTGTCLLGVPTLNNKQHQESCLQLDLEPTEKMCFSARLTPSSTQQTHSLVDAHISSGAGTSR